MAIMWKLSDMRPDLIKNEKGVLGLKLSLAIRLKNVKIGFVSR